MSSPGLNQLNQAARDAVVQRDAERERLRQRIMNMSLPHRLVYLMGLIRDTRRHFLLYCISVFIALYRNLYTVPLYSLDVLSFGFTDLLLYIYSICTVY